MRLNILIGGKAGQGINKISAIVSDTLAKHGYFTFNYRDYQSIIHGGHNFNVLSIADFWIASHESKLDGIVALDKNTLKLHKKELKKSGFVIDSKDFSKHDLGINLNTALAGCLIKILGLSKDILISEIKKSLGKQAVKAAELGYQSQEQRFSLRKLNNKISILSGTRGISIGALSSDLDLYIGYPMTPATGVLHELAGEAVKNQTGNRKNPEMKNKLLVFQPENEIAGVNMALGSGFAGAKTLIGTSGGGFDLMSEAMSFQGQSEIPLTIYLASRPGPGTGVPTYTAQDDLDAALRGGHGEFPRIVIAPGDPLEAQELTNQAMYLAEKFQTLSIILADKHLAESEYSLNKKPNPVLKIQTSRDLPGKKGNIVKANSYEHDKFGNTIECEELTILGAKKRLQKYLDIKKFLNKNKQIQMIKIHGNKKSRNLVIAWGSTKGAIIDAINSQDLDAKFLQVLYLKPLSDEIKKEMQKAERIILIENNVTGQLGRVLREKTRLKIDEENRILKFDARPFKSDGLCKEIKRRLR
jgi:2-oxoglutarate ferredoxin oxidoreductase subunit alpha